MGFWGKLDYIAISAYYPLGKVGSEVALRSAWKRIDAARIKPMWLRYHKKIIFGEVGYRSIAGGHTDPPEWSKCGTYDEQEQARDYNALFAYWRTRPYFTGVHLWQWNPDPARDWRATIGDFTPQDKAAEQSMTRWFSGPATHPAAATVTWPKPGAALPPTGRLRARVVGRASSSYTMTWQVDGGAANPMTDDGQDKTDGVDFSGWAWRADDRYRITFTAKDSASRVIARKNLDVYRAPVKAVQLTEGTVLRRERPRSKPVWVKHPPAPTRCAGPSTGTAATSRG